MRKYSLMFLVAFILLGSRSSSQQVIRLIEKDLEGNTYDSIRNVDINSQLIFKLSKDELLKKISSFSDTSNLPSDVDKLLQVLTGALKKKNEWMSGFANAVKTYQEGNKSDAVRFNGEQQQIANEMKQVLLSDDKLLTYFEEQPVENILNVWTQITNALNRRVNEVEEELLTSPKYNDIRVQMGGWLIHNGEKAPLHFDGLDTNPLGEFYEVERWRFTPTKEQIDEFERLQNLIKESKIKEANLAELIKSEYVSGFIKDLHQRFKTSLESLKTKFENLVDSIGAGIIKTDIQNIIAKGKDIIKLAEERISFYTNLKNDPSSSITKIVTSLTNDISTFTKVQKEMSDLLEKFKTDLRTALQAVKDRVANANLMIDEIIEELKKNFLKLDVFNVARIDDLALEFTDKVLSLSLKDIPEEPATDLRYSGYRVEGDKVVVKLIITKGEEKTHVYQETKDVTLYRILSHIETTVGVIFAHPLSETSIKKDFQMAPYYNALFKGLLQGKNGKKILRQKTLRNTIWQTSFGLHVSTPDFDKDDVPELGFGIVLSTLNDFLQVGTAYNIFHGTPYVFFGVRLPIGNINLGGKKDTGTSTNND